MKTDLDAVLDACDLVGGAVAPPTVLALVTAVRRCAAVIGMQAEIIHAGFVTGPQLEALADAMRDARIVELPDMPMPPRGRQNPPS